MNGINRVDYERSRFRLLKRVDLFDQTVEGVRLEKKGVPITED